MMDRVVKTEPEEIKETDSPEETNEPEMPNTFCEKFDGKEFWSSRKESFVLLKEWEDERK